jgi:hypothetical protein
MSNHFRMLLDYRLVYSFSSLNSPVSLIGLDIVASSAFSVRSRMSRRAIEFSVVFFRRLVY